MLACADCPRASCLTTVQGKMPMLVLPDGTALPESQVRLRVCSPAAIVHPCLASAASCRVAACPCYSLSWRRHAHMPVFLTTLSRSSRPTCSTSMQVWAPRCCPPPPSCGPRRSWRGAYTTSTFSRCRWVLLLVCTDVGCHNFSAAGGADARPAHPAAAGGCWLAALCSFSMYKKIDAGELFVPQLTAEAHAHAQLTSTSSFAGVHVQEDGCGGAARLAPLFTSNKYMHALFY